MTEMEQGHCCAPERGGTQAGPAPRLTTVAAACCVSNRDFATFVEATGHITEAESIGWSFVFAGLLPPDFPPTRAVVAAPWWRPVPDADWRRPEGGQSTLDGRADHPVVHVSWRDADAYC